MLKYLLPLILTHLTLAAKDIDVLAHKATDPIAPLSQIQFEDDFTTNNNSPYGESNSFFIKPVLSIRNHPVLPDELMRLKVPLETTAKSPTAESITALGDTQFFDLFIVQEGDWGRWAIGPIFIFPTATKTATGQGKWQVGPALGISYLAIKDWQFVLLLQNPISFAGNRERPYVNQMFLQPMITYHFGHGWYLRTDSQWSFTWSENSAQIPLDIGLGRVFKIGSLPSNLSLYAEWTAYHHNLDQVAQFTGKIEFNILFP